MKTFSITIDDEVYGFIVKESLTNQVSKSEIVRRHLVDSYYATTKQEEKIVKRFEEFERKIEEKINNSTEKLLKVMIKDSLYGLTNFHLIKAMITFIHQKSNQEVSKYISFAKSYSLYHPIDSINTKEKFESNILDEDFKK